jgi:hypothetical protein
MDQPVIRWVLDMLQQENWWMMVSNGNRDSSWMRAGTTPFPMARHSSKRRPTARSGAPTGRILSGPSG